MRVIQITLTLKKYSFGRELHHIFSGDSYNDLIQYLKSRYSSDANCPATSAETAGDWVNLFNPPYDPSVGDDLCSGNIAYPGWPGNGTLTCEGGLTITQYRGETCAGLERDFVPNRKRNTICAFTGYTRSHTSTLSFDDYTKAICYHGTSGSVTPPNSDINCGAEQTANPCIISTGDKVKAAQDFTSSSLGFTRYYNSTNTVNSLSIGMGWRHSYGDELYMYTSPQSGESYPRVVVWTNGNRIDLTPKSNSDDLEPSYTEVKSSDIDRVTPMNDEWHVFRENGNSRVYNAEGKLIRIHTRQGQVTSLNYDTQNRLATISDAYGRTISLEYSSELVNKATFPDGSQVLYGYDTNSNLISVTHPGVGNSAGQPLIYHYEDTRFPNHKHRLTPTMRWVGPAVPKKPKQHLMLGRNELSWNTNRTGAREMNNNNLSTLILSGSLVFAAANPALAANVTIVTDAIGTQEKWTFVDQYGSKRMTRRENLSDGRLYKQTWYSHGDLANKHDEKNRQTSYTYDYYTQQLTNESQPYRGAGRYGGVWSWGLWKNTSYEYVSPDTDLVTKTTTNGIFDFQNKETVNTYDDNLNLTSVTINGFNADGQSVSRQTNFEFDQFGKVTQIDGPRTDVADITTLVYYNCTTGAECGELQQVVNALGHITTYDHYDGAGRLLQSTDPNGTSTAYSYHPRGWLLSMVQTPVSGTARITDYQYDNTGQLTQVTLPDGAALNYVYDAAHDLRETSDNLGNKVTYTYDAKGNLTHELVHDPDGILVNSTVTTYDIHNFVQSINRGGSLMQFSTDETGNVSAAVDPNSNPNTTHEYDLLDRLASTVDALTNTSAYSYNVADQLTQVTAPNGAVTQYEYDDLGNQTKEISADRGTITYAHDDAGNVTSMTDQLPIRCPQPINRRKLPNVNRGYHLHLRHGLQ